MIVVWLFLIDNIFRLGWVGVCACMCACVYVCDRDNIMLFSNTDCFWYSRRSRSGMFCCDIISLSVIFLFVVNLVCYRLTAFLTPTV